MTDKQQPHDDVLKRLVHDLETMNTLCKVKDYPGVELKKLNLRVKKIGPLVNPVFGEQLAFFIDEGRFIPYRMVNYGNEKVAAKISRVLDLWATCSGQGGHAIISRGAFVFGTDVRMPDIAYMPRDTDRGLSPESTWTYHGEPFVPTFVVEIDKLYGRGSQRKNLDRKMRDEYFQHGVQLGWLIDPRPKVQLMYEYYLDDNGDVQCSDTNAWRDLDGGDVLPGFKIRAPTLEMVLNQDSGSSSEEEVDFTCPERGCRKRFRSRSAWTAHTEWHREETAIAKYLAKRQRQNA
ncbi:hypothetical protein DVH05_022276 [Phytophthora capsici]|nr:hypothetical protein DVH05_022276 [Phytophthora capsici]|eukprot:jgi/Phyca11/114334/e_gw1.26.383.1